SRSRTSAGVSCRGGPKTCYVRSRSAVPIAAGWASGRPSPAKASKSTAGRSARATCLAADVSSRSTCQACPRTRREPLTRSPPVHPAKGQNASSAEILNQATLGGPEGPLARLDGVRVLVVEDDPDSRELICKLLEMAGATVHCVDSV